MIRALAILLMLSGCASAQSGPSNEDIGSVFGMMVGATGGESSVVIRSWRELLLAVFLGS